MTAVYKKENESMEHLIKRFIEATRGIKSEWLEKEFFVSETEKRQLAYKRKRWKVKKTLEFGQ